MTLSTIFSVFTCFTTVGFFHDIRIQLWCKPNTNHMGPKESRCLRKLIHNEGEIEVTYSIAWEMIVLGHGVRVLELV